jgi:hypothetical protein
MNCELKDIKQRNYNMILDHNKSRCGIFESPSIAETIIDSKLNNNITLPLEMKFDIGNTDKYWPFVLFSLFFVPLSINSFLKQSYEDALGLTFLLIFFLLIILYNHESILYKGNVILNRSGIKLFEHDIIFWDNIVGTYIVNVGSGRYLRTFLTISLKDGGFVEQEVLLEWPSKYSNIGHYIEQYKKAPNNDNAIYFSDEQASRYLGNG